MLVTNVIDEFIRCLGSVSFTRAGWDVRDMAPVQKQGEAESGAKGMARARQIWKDNPDKQDELRAAFVKFNPLVEMREIERS